MSTPHPNNPPPLVTIKPLPRGRGCGLILATAALLILALMVYGVRNHTRTYGFGKMSEAEIVAYEKWVDKPLAIPADKLRQPHFADADLITSKTELFRQAINLDSSLSSRFNNPEQNGVWEKWDNLTPDQNAALLAAFQPVVANASALASDPHYRLNIGNYIPVDVQPIDDYEGVEALQNIIVTQFKIQATNNQTDEACQSLELILDLLSCDPFISHYYLERVACSAVEVAGSAKAMAARSSEEAFVTRILAILRAHREALLAGDIDVTMLSGNIGLLTQMHRDGYIQNLHLTPRNLVHAEAYEKEQYFRWLARKIPKSDPRYAHVQAVAKIYGPDPRSGLHPASLFVRGFEMFITAATMGIDPPAYPMAFRRRQTFDMMMPGIDDYDAACRDLEARLQQIR